MKYIFFIIASLFWGNISYASGFDMTSAEVEAIAPILNIYIVISTVIIAILTIVVVFQNARKMKGGVFSVVLGYFGMGMTAVFLGFSVSILPILSLGGVGEVIHQILFIVGYVCMAIAATKLSSAIRG